MSASDTRSWYQTIGWKSLNSKLIKYSGLGIGTIPISNLEFVPEWADLQTLAGLIASDGCKAFYQSGENDIILTVN